MKKHFLTIAAVMIAVFAVAFTPQKKQLKHADPFWYYTGSATAGHNTASLYEPLDEQDVSLCEAEASEVRCVIEAPELEIQQVPQGVPDLSGVIIEHSFKPE